MGNGSGRVVARVGEWVRMGGNPLDGPLKASNVVGGETTVRELRERCPGAYWVATPDRMHVIQQRKADTHVIHRVAWKVPSHGSQYAPSWIKSPAGTGSDQPVDQGAEGEEHKMSWPE